MVKDLSNENIYNFLVYLMNDVQFRIILIPLVTILILLAGYMLFNFISHNICTSKCNKNPSQIYYANVSGHGINHVCYDECYGGVITI